MLVMKHYGARRGSVILQVGEEVAGCKGWREIVIHEFTPQMPARTTAWPGCSGVPGSQGFEPSAAASQAHLQEAGLEVE